MDWGLYYPTTRIPPHYIPTNHWHPYSPIPPRVPPYYSGAPLISYPWNPRYAPIPSLHHPYPEPPRILSNSYRPRKRRHRALTHTNASILDRTWESISESSCEDPEFSVLCFNLLSQDLLELHQDLYTHCSPTYAAWEYRKYYLLEQLIESSADILCLQEVHYSAYDSFFSPNLREKNYQGAYKRRTGEHEDGVAIFFNTEKFELVTCRPVEFLRGSILDRDNVAIILKLKVISESSSQDNFLYVATTHLLFNPKAGDVKLAQLCTLLAEIRDLTSRDKETHPLIICGDFNCLPNSCLYLFIRSGYLNYKYLCRSEVAGYKKPSSALLPYPLMPPQLGITNACEKIPNPYSTFYKSKPDDASIDSDNSVTEQRDKSYILSHPYSFHSVYHHSISQLPHVSTFHGSAFENVDYIFYSAPELEINEQGVYEASRKLKLVSRYSMPTRENLRKFGPLPNKYHSSDHLQLLSKFRYTH